MAEAISQTKQRLLIFLFSLLAVGGQVGQNVSLPLWIDAGRTGNCLNFSIDSNTTSNCTTARHIDSYFVYTFSCLNFVIIFGCMLPILHFVKPGSIGETERQFPQLPLLIIGLFDALNGVLVVFASSGERTLPALQPILANFLIPLTVICRLLVLGKKPSLLKLMCAIAVFAALILSLVPTFIPSLGGDLSGGAKGLAKFLWPLVFMFGFLPAAIMNVLQEKWLKYQMQPLNQTEQPRKLNLIFFLFCTSFYQLLTATVLFWVDVIPGYGNAASLHELLDSWRFGIVCFFGGDGCSFATGVRGSCFILMYTLSYIGGGLLLRYAEGATLLAIINSLVTPLGFLFWTFFNENPFYFQLETGPITWFALASLALMLPAICLYNSRADDGNDDEMQQLLIQNDYHKNGDSGVKVYS